MTIFLTILSGVCVYVLGQITIKFVIDPIHAQRETIGRIIDFLIYHGNRYTSPGLPPHDGPRGRNWAKDREVQLVETKYAARQLASDLMVKTQAVPAYGFWERVGLVRARSDIRTAQRNLIRISNSLLHADGKTGLANANCASEIEAALGIVTEFKVDEKDMQPTNEEPDSASSGNEG